MIHFTAQEERIINVLADGKPHPKSELMKCLWDELSSQTALAMCISGIRVKLAPYEQYIHCIEGRNGDESHYIHLVRKTVVMRTERAR